MHSWILGSQNNWWNNVKLSEAFTRVITGNNNKGSFVAKSNTEPDDSVSLFQVTASINTLGSYPGVGQFYTSHLSLLDALNSKNQKESTWQIVSEALKKVKVDGIHSPFVIFAKTGTADDIAVGKTQFARRNRQLHNGLFMFTIMTEAQYSQLQNYIKSGYNESYLPSSLGITGVISLALVDFESKETDYCSSFAKKFLADTERLKSIIILNKHLFR